jgi:type I restriction enzyme R subunit
LDSQTTEEFNKFEAGSVDVTDRTDVLVRQMKDKNRQLIVTTMQKMANAVKRPQYEKVMDAYKDEKVVFIIDECHRSQFGDMHKDIVLHIRKAQFFASRGHLLKSTVKMRVKPRKQQKCSLVSVFTIT